jgi:ubiquitin carboxyl-terminal hydrolase 1
MSSHEYSYDTHTYDRQNLSTTATSFLTAAVVGAYVLYKVLEVSGYPVGLWLHKATAMAMEASPTQLLRQLPGLGGPDSDSEDSQQTGGALNSVFGLGGNSLFGKGLSGVTGALTKTRKPVPAGLGNWDNSCYQNSIIQGMASLPSLREYLYKATTGENALAADTTTGALFDMINKLNDPQHHGQQFWIRGVLKSMSTFQQQDAQEYYSKILDAMDKEVQGASKSKKQSSASLLSATKSLGDSEQSAAEADDKDQPSEQAATAPNPLDGLLAQRVGCVECGYTEGLSLIPFNCLTVPLGPNGAYHIADCLDEYTHLEYIEDVVCAKCTVLKMQKTLTSMKIPPGSPLADRLQAVNEVLEDEDFEDKTVINKCKLLKKNWVKSTKSRQAVIARAPKSLVIHVNRSIFDEMTGFQYKNHAAVVYPKVLDLATWCLGSRPSHSQRPDESIEEAWPRDPRQSMISGSASADSASDSPSPFQYSLKALITHFGNHGSGHYVCYRQHAFKPPDLEGKTEGQEGQDEKVDAPHSDEQWWRLSDETVNEVSEREALNQSNVFMLFYERVDADERSLSAAEAESQGAELSTEACQEQMSELRASGPQLDGVPLDDIPLDDAAAEVPLPDSDADSIPASPSPSPSSSELPLPSDTSSSILPPTKRARTSTSPSPADDGNQNPDSAPLAPTTTTSQIPNPTAQSASSDPSEDTEMSERDSEPPNSSYDSEGAPSTLLTSDDDASVEKQEHDVEAVPMGRTGPTSMKTAGDSPGSGSAASQRERERGTATARLVGAT